jgi:predicted DNA-binding mobile mystery protein A
MQFKSQQAKFNRNQVSGNLKNLSAVQKPAQGWIRSVRAALGMSGRQLAERLGVEPPRVTLMEKAELTKSLTLRSLEKAAQALDCRLVYALVPNTSLEDTVHRQASSVARRRLKTVSHTMRLEDQGLRDTDEKKLLKEMTENLVREMPRSLWDESDKL